MPNLNAPERRHFGRAERTIERPAGTQGPSQVIVGVVYDPSRVPAAKLDDLFDTKLKEVWDEATRRRHYTIDGAGAAFSPWEAVARMEAEHPGDILPHPGLKIPQALQYPRWYPSAEEKRAMEKEREAKEKGAYIAETGDWAVDGEGA